MKRFFSALVAFIMLCSFTSCTGADKSTVILDNSQNSYFVDFYTEKDVVYIECVLNIYNSAKSSVKVKISAIDNEDVKIGLLKNAELYGIDKNGNDTFTLESGENSVTVLFKGDYAGIYQITQRDIPRFISIEKI